jgi:hypothetical protein
MIVRFIRKCWAWKWNFVRRYPILCMWLAWIEGIVIGFLISYFFFSDVLVVTLSPAGTMVEQLW